MEEKAFIEKHKSDDNSVQRTELTWLTHLVRAEWEGVKGAALEKSENGKGLERRVRRGRGRARRGNALELRDGGDSVTNGMRRSDKQ